MNTDKIVVYRGTFAPQEAGVTRARILSRRNHNSVNFIHSTHDTRGTRVEPWYTWFSGIKKCYFISGLHRAWTLNETESDSSFHTLVIAALG